MTKARPETRERCDQDNDAGFTLIEVALTLVLTLVAALLVFPALKTVSDGSLVLQQQATDNVIMAATFLPLTKEISSAVVVYSPSPSSGTNYSTQDTGTQAGDALVVLSQAGGTLRCDQWAISTAGELEQRSWLPSSSTATAFIPVEPAIYPPPTTPFTMTTGTPTAVTVALDLRPSANQASLSISTTLNATNVGTLAMATDCETAPAA